MGEGEAERGVLKVLKPRNLKKWWGGAVGSEVGGAVSKRTKSYFQIIFSVAGIIFS